MLLRKVGRGGVNGVLLKIIGGTNIIRVATKGRDRRRRYFALDIFSTKTFIHFPDLIRFFLDERDVSLELAWRIVDNRFLPCDASGAPFQNCAVSSISLPKFFSLHNWRHLCILWRIT